MFLLDVHIKNRSEVVDNFSPFEELYPMYLNNVCLEACNHKKKQKKKKQSLKNFFVYTKNYIAKLKLDEHLANFRVTVALLNQNGQKYLRDTFSKKDN